MRYKLSLKFNKWLSILGIIILILMFGDLLFLFFKALHQLESELCASISGGVLSIITGIISICFTQNRIKNRTFKVNLSQKKAMIYRKLIQHVSQESHNNPSAKDSLHSMHQNLLLWGDPKVISIYAKYLNQSQEKINKDTLLELLYLAIRTDLNIKNSNILNQEILKLIS